MVYSSDFFRNFFSVGVRCRALFCCLVFAAFSAFTAAPDMPSEMPETDAQLIIDNTADWNFILSRLNSQILRANQTLDRFLLSSRQKENSFLKFRQKINRQTDELRFLLSVCDPEDVFGITLCCQQIDETRNLYLKSYNRLLSLMKSNRQLSSRLKGIFNELERMSVNPKYARYRSKILASMEQYKIFVTNTKIIEANLKSFINDELLNSLTLLTGTAEKVRSDTIDNIFFSPQATYWQLLPMWRLIVEYWFHTLSDMYHMTKNLPFTEMGITLVCIMLPCIFGMAVFGRRKLTPWLIKISGRAEKSPRTKLFAVAEIIMGVAMAFYIYQLFAPPSYMAQIHQFSLSLLSYSMLFFALAIRVEHKQLPRSVLLYSPFIAQSLLANVMYFFVFPYQPLMLLTVPINTIVFGSALFFMLFYGKKCSRFDKSAVWCAMGAIVVETLLAANGFLYIGFTMMLTGMIVLGLFLAEVSTSRILLAKIRKSENKMIKMVLFHLILPLLWMGGLAVVIGNISSTYHLRSWAERMIMIEVNIHNIFVISIINVITVVIVMLCLIFIIAFAKATVNDLYKDSPDLGKVSSYLTLGTYIAWTFFAIFVLIISRIQYSSLLVILGGFSVGFGFAMKEVLENFISGIILLIGQQVRPGDEIEFDGNEGIVRNVSFRATVIETFDGTIITLPNTNVLSKDFRNCTRKGHRMRHDLVVGVAYDSDLQQVRGALLDAAAAVPEIYCLPVPEVHCSKLSESSIDFTVRFWIRSGEQTRVFSALREKIVQLFRERNIEIPYNRLDVHLDKQ